MNEGVAAYKLAKKLFPIYRSITGDGVRESLRLIDEYIGKGTLSIHEVRSGEKAFDWKVPREWNINDAYIEDEQGNRFAEFKENNLHVVGYSTPLDRWMDLNELTKHIYTQKDQPDAIPYVTSYYSERFGFCMSEEEKRMLHPGKYHAVIDSVFTEGALTYADIIIPGETDEEILFSTYTCHPSMANDNCSGMVLSASLAKYIKSLEKRRYTYRFVFAPETIGAIVYLSQKNRLEYMKKHTKGGFTFSCVGDSGGYSVINSKHADSLCDRAISNILSLANVEIKNVYRQYSFLQRGSDERQYSSPGVGIPVVGFCRTKYWEFPEYHTSLDTMDYISTDGLQGSFDIMKQVVDLIEFNRKYKMAIPCEPQLGKRGLYPNVSQKGIYDEVQAMMDFIAYADGETDFIQISNDIKQPATVLIPIVNKLIDEELVISEDIG